MQYFNKLILILPFFILTNKALAQQKQADTTYKLVAADTAHKKTKFHEWLWGHNRRTEWATPISVPVLWLNTFKGGLIPDKEGGGNETKSLRLQTSNGKEYTLRSIRKSREDVIPTEFKNTFVGDIIKDGVFMSHPYAALALAAMQESAGIYHTEPIIVYVPRQRALDTFKYKFGNDLYLFEQRLDGDWSDAKNLGNFKNFTSTKDVIEKLQEDNDYKADQAAFVKARLFDMLIADWDRHEDNWQWGLRESHGRSVFIPVPRDRDQAFFTHRGVLIDKVLPASGQGFMKNFGDKVTDVNGLNWEERYMDRFFTSEMGLDDWVKIAKDLQVALTDVVIAQSIQQLPPEIFAVSGNELIEKLKNRREQLVDFSSEYYRHLATEVQVLGSKKKEYFEINKTNSGETELKIFAVKKDGKSDSPYYTRLFKPSETKEVRVFGLAGEDIYSVKGVTNDIKLRIIGGVDKDSVIQTSGSRIDIYDDANNVFKTTAAKLHLSKDSAIHEYNYKDYRPDKKGISPTISYNNADRFYVGLGYGFNSYKWRKEPFATKQLLEFRYSISQKDISVVYNAEYPNVLGKWDLLLAGNYDAVRWTNFFGTGNGTVLTTDHKDYYRMRTREWSGKAGFKNEFGKSGVEISGFFESVRIIADTERYVAKVFLPVNQDAFETNNYIGAHLNYTYLSLNDSIVPTKGITFSGNAVYYNNISRNEFFQKYFGRMQLYIPLGNKFSLAVRTGASTIVGDSAIYNSAEFYEHSVIGAAELRGFKRERFWGKTSFFNNNELRFITNIRSHLLNAKAGLLVFYDDGRVWMPGEKNNTFHTGYGGGILLAPFNMAAITLTYGISEESKLFQIRVNKLF